MISNVGSFFYEEKESSNEQSISSSEALVKKLGLLEAGLPEDLLFMLRDYLSFEDLGQWAATIKDPALRARIVHQGYFIQRCVLPEERFGENEWIQKNIAPIPKEMQEILDGPDGHLYTAIFKAHYFLTKEGQIVPARFETIDEVAKKKDSHCPGIGMIDIDMKRLQTVPEKKNMHWMLVTKTVVEGSRNKKWVTQKRVFCDWIKDRKERQGFEITKVETLVYALLWHYQASDHERIYTDNPLTYGRCLMEDKLVEVGAFWPSRGFAVVFTFIDSIQATPYVGVGGERKFFKAIGPWKLES